MIFRLVAKLFKILIFLFFSIGDIIILLSFCPFYCSKSIIVQINQNSSLKIGIYHPISS